MDRRLLIVASVIGLHVAGLWALQAGLLQRAVELVVPVSVVADLIEPPQPQVTPMPTPKTSPTPVSQAQPAPRPAPVPLAIKDPSPTERAPSGAITAPPAPLPSVTEPVAAEPAAPPPPQAPASRNVKDNFRDLPPPPYPGVSQRMNEQGSVKLAIRVESSGSASDVTVTRSSGFPRLDEAAVKAAYQWRYVPRNGGAPAPGVYEYVVRFELN